VHGAWFVYLYFFRVGCCMKGETAMGVKLSPVIACSDWATC
jgi:hypothetical protein